MLFVNIKFAGGEYIRVPRSFTYGMCDVFRDTDTIHANALEFEHHGHLIHRIASVFSDEDKTTRVRAIARIVTLDNKELVRVLEFSNYFCHDIVLDIAASTLAKRMPRLSTAEIADIFDIDDSTQRQYAPSHHMMRHVSSFTN